MEGDLRATRRRKLQTLIGLGWVPYERDHRALSPKRMDLSLDCFERALKVVPESAEALLG